MVEVWPVLQVCVALVADFFRHHQLRPGDVVEIEFLGGGRVRWVEEHSSAYSFGDLAPADRVATEELLERVEGMRRRYSETVETAERVLQW